MTPGCTFLLNTSALQPVSPACWSSTCMLTPGGLGLAPVCGGITEVLLCLWHNYELLRDKTCTLPSNVIDSGIKCMLGLLVAVHILGCWMINDTVRIKGYDQGKGLKWPVKTHCDNSAMLFLHYTTPGRGLRCQNLSSLTNRLMSTVLSYCHQLDVLYAC